MFSYVYLSLFAASLASASVIPRQAPNTGPFQTIKVKPDNTFHNGAVQLNAEPPTSNDIPPAVYGARDIDLPFNRLYHGKMKFFSEGQLNSPTGIQDVWHPGQNDYANQSACGIPDNAYSASKVAVHPYFLKYADLSRYCMQDVCISFWKEDGTSDMMLKVTDICSTDPNDPTHCESPADIKVERSKVGVMEGLTANPLTSYPQLTGNEFPEKTWWFFMKCWADGLPQPAYQDNNWFTSPPLANNLKWAQDTATEQYKNNQVAYAAKGWPTYPNGAYDPKRDDTTSPPITDWVPGQEPKYQPIAGGKGWGDYSAVASVASQGTFGSAATGTTNPISTIGVAPVSSAVSASPSTTTAAVAGDGPSLSASASTLSSLTPASPSFGGAAAPTGSATPLPPNAGPTAPLGNGTAPGAASSTGISDALSINSTPNDGGDDNTCEA